MCRKDIPPDILELAVLVRYNVNENGQQDRWTILEQGDVVEDLKERMRTLLRQAAFEVNLSAKSSWMNVDFSFFVPRHFRQYSQFADIDLETEVYIYMRSA